MRIRRVVGWILFPLLFLAACSAPPRERPVATPPAQNGKPSAPAGPQTRAPVEEPSPKSPGVKPLAVRFLLYTGPVGAGYSDSKREAMPGETVTMGLEPFHLTVILPELNEQAARQALKVEGAQLASAPVWLPEGGMALQFGPGTAEQVLTVRIQASGKVPVVLTVRRSAPAVVTVDQRFGDKWKPLVVLDAYTTPGPSSIRLSFSKPVRKPEIEQALLAAQSVPIRGLMEWTDEKTLIWQIAELPPRLDFLLGGAHDLDGLPLPGGVPSLRLGGPPQLVEVDTARPSDQVLGTVPPDIISAALNSEMKVVNLKAWTPGTTKWDWQTAEIHFDLARKTLKKGRIEESQPRLAADLDNWVVSPNRALVAGLKARGDTTKSHQADLVVMDMRGGRSQTFSQAISRFRGADQLDLTTHLAWGPDSGVIAALSYAGDPQRSDLVFVEATTGKTTLVIPGLPVRPDGTRLAWSPSGRWLLAGNLLVDLASKAFRTLGGSASQAVGVWEPGSDRLLYGLKDWGQILIVEPAGDTVRPVGDGLVVGWTGPGRALVIRWPGSAARYTPPGQ